MTANGSGRPEPVDVDALMSEIRRRVAEKKAKGLYGVDALAAASLDDTGPLAPEELERLREMAVQGVEFDTSAPAVPVVGPALGLLKYRLSRAVSGPLYGIATRSTRFNAAMLGYVARLGLEVSSLRRELETTRAEARSASARAHELTAALTDALGRLTAAEGALGRLRGEALHERLARLEYAAPADGGRAVVPAPGPALAPAGLLGVVLEARDWSDADAGRWAAALGDAASPVLHLGCGSGRALAVLGPDARGIDDDPELASAGQREGRAVTCADPVAHAAALGEGTLGGALVTGLVERLDGPRIATLVTALARALGDGGRLVVDGVDPRVEGALAGDVWRDPRNVRPLHPDAVVAVIEAAGLTVAAVTDPEDGGRFLVHATA